MKVVRQGGLWCRVADERRESEADALRALARRTVAHLQMAVPAANFVGGTIVFAYYFFAFRPPGQTGLAAPLVNAIVGIIGFCAFAAVGRYRGRRASGAMLKWRDGQEPTAAERRALLKLPARMALISATNWGVAVPIFFFLNLSYSFAFAGDVAVSLVLAGAAVCAIAYLVAERIVRPVVAHVLADDPSPEGGSLGIAPRLMGTWALLAGIPLLMIALIPTGTEVNSAHDLIAPIWFVVVAALAFGALGMKLATQAVARPVRDLRRAMDAVGDGEHDVRVTVDDASEIGRLQAGFNAMVAGLRERELLRELFGRQVGDDVAREALERGVTLGGQSRTVSALFVDVIGSTALAVREPPERVVAILNEFFAAVVETIDAHGGLVNKFEGDGAVCIFGAPVEREDHAACALAAARELRDRLAELRRSGTPLEAAIGVSCGRVVAGHVGAEKRYEYTVIGDPVNEAARLRDLAKSRPGRLLASATTVEQAGPDEARHWCDAGEARLRGRGAPTPLAVPGDAEAAAAGTAA
jgi:adenylate cyclase